MRTSHRLWVLAAVAAVGGSLFPPGTAAARADELGGISGRVWLDRDGNGVFDDTDALFPVIEDIRISRADGTWSGSVELSHGVFAVADLAPGRYVVDGAVPAYASTTPSQVSVLVPPGGVAEVEFGIRGGTISGVVWLDENEDGVRQDAEPLGVPGRTMRMSAYDTVTTFHVTDVDGQGRFLFQDLPATEYILDTFLAVQPEFGPTRPFVGAPERDSDLDWNLGDGRRVAIEVREDGYATTATNIDAGFVRNRRDLVAEELTATPDGDLAVGQPVVLRAVVGNRGNTTARMQGQVRLPAGLRIVAATSTEQTSVSGQLVKVGWRSHYHPPGTFEVLITAVVDALPTDPVRFTVVDVLDPDLPETNPDNNALTLTL
ncbi:SdrD B-like domain-containing protein [Goodfellowiella coeruleoviolacea]|uniref:SD-repeat containing protein B domain-containing protein n=1 Tax=Goodfellowiella coeruleoviolacea TaxID=334858 RepID=A0AAE3G8K3_9PSEU|nr:SdrD B-like domain-containing protein [Goodfellowiella coeruleoviolacea]MCP2163263.1 hypothetical protein [Goodfellowiella coeruleoviolacea]